MCMTHLSSTALCLSSVCTHALISQSCHHNGTICSTSTTHAHSLTNLHAPHNTEDTCSSRTHQMSPTRHRCMHLNNHTTAKVKVGVETHATCILTLHSHWLQLTHASQSTPEKATPTKPSQAPEASATTLCNPQPSLLQLLPTRPATTPSDLPAAAEALESPLSLDIL